MPTDEPASNESEQMGYDEIVELCKQNVGTIIRIVDEDVERIHFSPHQHPETHTTLIRAAIWKTDIPNLSGPRWQISAGRGLGSMDGGISVVNEGNEHYPSYWEAVERIEELAAEYDGEDLRWRDLPKRCFRSDGEEITQPYFGKDDRSEGSQ